MTAIVNDVLQTLTERARWYRDGCDGLEDREGYYASGDCARDAASDLETALSEIRVLERVIVLLRGQGASPADRVPATLRQALIQEGEQLLRSVGHPRYRDGLAYVPVRWLEQIVAELRPGDPHRCNGCGHRWNGPLLGAELCGDCWRTAQPVLQQSPRLDGICCGCKGAILSGQEHVCPRPRTFGDASGGGLRP